MSKVFSAKRQNVTVTYEFTDGTTTSITVQSLSTNEGIDIGTVVEDKEAKLSDLYEKIARIHLAKNDAEIVNRIIKEQYDEGNIRDFANGLSELIEETKKGKLKD